MPVKFVGAPICRIPVLPWNVTGPLKAPLRASALPPAMVAELLAETPVAVKGFDQMLQSVPSLARTKSVSGLEPMRCAFTFYRRAH